MPAIEIACPKCGRKLKLPDSSLLGRKGRCSKCRHGFILQAPETKAVHFAEAPAEARPQFEFAGADENLDVDSDKTLMGVAVRFVPPEIREQFTATSTPSPAASVPPLPPAAEEISSLAEVLVESSSDEDTADELARVRRLRQQTKKKRLMMGSVAVVAVLAVGIGVSLGLSKNSGNVSRKNGTQAASAKKVAAAETEGGADGAKEGGFPAVKPGEQVTLNLVPEGARIVIHLRPADLWQGAESTEEFRACLGPLGVWLEGAIKQYCLMEPAAVEEALFALIPVSRDAFDVAVAVRSKADLKRSDLITKFNGELVDTPKPHYVGPERAWIIGSNRTFASAPKDMAQSLAESVDTPSITSDGVQALLSMTDRKRHFTFVCDLEDLRLGVKTLAPENAQKFLEGIVDFFGDDVDAVCWSFQLGDPEGANNFKSQVLVRNKLTRTPAKLQGDLKKKLAQLPADVLEVVKMTHPREVGKKKIVGRYPIMTKMLEQKTRFETGHRLVAMNVELPERAGPNLALGTLLTWNQTTLPDFGSGQAPAPVAVAAKPALPDKIADRLKKKITVDFRREFLYKAVEFIGEETGVTIKLDGPGMKEVGITQNEYQSFALEDAPATAVLQKILGPKKLLLIVDEQAKIATITSAPMAERKNLTPFPLEPAPK